MLVLMILLIAAPISIISPLLFDPVSASPDPAGKTTIGLYNLCSMVIENENETFEIIVRGKETAYTFDSDATPPQENYVAGDRPPVMAAKRVDSGAVVAASISGSLRNSQWNSPMNVDRHLDILLDCAFQWMVPGAENVLWYGETKDETSSFLDYRVYDTPGRCYEMVDSLTGLGYKIDNTIDGVPTEITSGLLAGYDILLLPTLELGDPGTGGNPDDLPDNVVQTIEDFVRAGGGLLIMDESDSGGFNFCNVTNKIMRVFPMGIYFQSDEVQDNVNAYWHVREIYADVDNTTAIGSAYENATALLLPYNVDVDILPGDRSGIPGAMLSYYVNVKNVGLENDNYVLTAAGSENWSLNIFPDKLYVAAGMTKTSMLKVRIPSEASLGAKDTITVTATSQSDNTVSDNGTCTAIVATYPNIISNADKVKISNPYRNYENWFKGSFHFHSEWSEGSPLSEMIPKYRSEGYSFVALTDHNYVGAPPENVENYILTENIQDFVGINGIEYMGPVSHELGIDIEYGVENLWLENVAEITAEILAQGGIPMPAHPGYSVCPFPIENLRQVMDAGGRHMEIHAKTMEESQLCRQYWETLLTEGRLVYGTMDDDARSPEEVGRYGWNMVNAQELTKEAILQSLREGNFYCVQSSPPWLGIGPEIYSITVENENVISISSSGNHVLFIGDNGVVLDGKDLIDGKASSSIIHGASYIRMEVYGDNGAVSCTQPMMVSSVKFDLVTPQEISLDVNLWLENGSKVVVKFYGYDNIYQAESVLENFIPPVRIMKFENILHPENKPVEKVLLQVTGESTENVISTIASFTVSRGVSVDISPSEKSAPPSQTLSYTVTVRNTGNVKDTYTLENKDNSGWALMLENSSLEVLENESKTTTLLVTIPDNAVPCTRDNITVTATSQVDPIVSDNASCLTHVVTWAGTTTFKLENLYKVSLKKDLQLYTGSKLVVKFYKYDNVTPDNQSIIDTFVPPMTILENENVPHPSGLVPVEIARLVLTTDNENEVISTIVSFTATRSVLANRYLAIKGEYVKPGADKPALATEYLKVKTQYIKAP